MLHNPKADKLLKDLLKLNKALQTSETPKQGDSKPYYVGLVVIDGKKNKILLGHRSEDNSWTGPGGGAERTETPKQAAIREAFEEANLQLKADDLVELSSIVCFNGKMCHTFMAYVDSARVKVHSGNDPDNEVDKWEWHDLNARLPHMNPNRMVTVNAAKMKHYGLIKAIMEQPDAGIDLNTSEQSIDEQAAGNNVWMDLISSTMAGAGFGDAPRELDLPNHLKLFIAKVDDGIYSAIVKKDDPEAGDHGEVQCQLVKMTVEAMIQALKAKDYLPKREISILNSVPNSSANVPSPIEAPTRKVNEYAGLYRVLKQHEGELHIHLHKSKCAKCGTDHLDECRAKEKNISIVTPEDKQKPKRGPMILFRSLFEALTQDIV